MWRYRKHAVVSAWTLCLAGFCVLSVIPDGYESRATVYVDPGSVLGPLLQGIAVERNAGTQIAMMSSAIHSRPTLEKVARETGLANRAHDAAQFEQLVGALNKGIDLDSGSRSNTYTISFVDRDPVMAQKVVDQLLTSYMEDSLGLKRTDASMASGFLRQQIAEYDQRLRDAEDRLAKFKKENLGLMPGQSGDYYTRLQNLITSVETLQSRRKMLETRRSELSRQLSGEAPIYGAGDGGMPSPIDEQIAQANEKLGQLLGVYTENYPEVIDLRAQIARLQLQKQSEPAGAAPAIVSTTTADGKSVPVVNINPVYQNLRMSLAQTGTELAEVRGQIEDQHQQILELKSRINTIPDVEARLAQLNRDYEVNRAQHAALLQRLESARISGAAEESSDKVTFRVMERPVVPLVPTKPKRTLLLMVIFLISIGGGVGVSFVMQTMNPTFHNTRSLRDVPGLKVLGSVSTVTFPDTREWFRRPAAVFAGSVAMLFVFLGVEVLVAQRFGALLRSVIGIHS
jgi:polysaccharide chain length determinant protein (PEP-CTERM system associated)